MIARAHILNSKTFLLFLTLIFQDPASVPNGFQFRFPYKKSLYPLYTHSFAGYGYNVAREAIIAESPVKKEGQKHGTSVETVLDPCGLLGYETTLNVNSTVVHLMGQGVLSASEFS